MAGAGGAAAAEAWAGSSADDEETHWGSPLTTTEEANSRLSGTPRNLMAYSSMSLLTSDLDLSSFSLPCINSWTLMKVYVFTVISAGTSWRCHIGGIPGGRNGWPFGISRRRSSRT